MLYFLGCFFNSSDLIDNLRLLKLDQNMWVITLNLLLTNGLKGFFHIGEKHLTLMYIIIIIVDFVTIIIIIIFGLHAQCI